LLVLLIVVAGFGGWNFRKEISALISGEVSVTPAPSWRRPVPSDPEALPAGSGTGDETLLHQAEMAEGNKTENVPSAPPEPEMKAASLFLDEQASLAGLCWLGHVGLFNDKERLNSPAANEVHLGLYWFHAEAEQYIMFKKPFRIRVPDPAHHPDPGHSGALPLPRYLLIREVTADGAIAIDADGKEQLITRDFILTHWGQEVCWMYPYENKSTNLARGMSGREVMKLQHTLNEIGYSVEPTGRYDKSTFRQVMRFQSDFALKADGIVGTRTKGLLYQMSDSN
jgi:hypothetical protein